MILKSEKELRDIYGHPSGRAKDKVLNSLDKHAKNFISKSPFLVLSTVGSNNRIDASPRGGNAGFVNITENGELLIPDFKGNNRIDSLVNITQTNAIGLLFFIPGIDETLRVNGKASISVAPDLLENVAENGKSPISCIIVTIEEVFLHCAKAFMRSKLWSPEFQMDAANFPSMGEMLKDQLKTEGPAESREDMIKRYTSDL